MIAHHYFGITNRGFLTWSENRTRLVAGDFCDQLFSQTLLPCQGKPGLQSEAALILFGNLHPHQFRESHVDTAARF